MTKNYEDDYKASRALLAWQIERDAEIVKTLVDDPALFARLRVMPGPLSRVPDIVARVDAELALIAMNEIFK